MLSDRVHWTHEAPCSAPCAKQLLVLSLWQPWATLVVATDPLKKQQIALLDRGLFGLKGNETRHWKPRLELPYTVVIHAAKRYDGNTRDCYTRWPFKEALERAGFFAGDPRPLLKRKEIVETLDGRKLRPVPLGALVGIVQIYDVVDTTQWLKEGADQGGEFYAEEQQFGDYSPSRFAWRLRWPQMFDEPIPFSGRQEALYPIDERTHELIYSRLQATWSRAATP